MANIELVIKISEDIYNHTQEYEVGGFNQENDTKLFMAIKNGTPLPKGCGRLIDANVLSFRLNEAQIEGTDTYKGLGEAKQIVDDAPTIIDTSKRK